MIAYLMRRLAYMIPILIGVNIITFAMFFIVNTPDNIAKLHLGQKYATEEAVQDWKHQHGYDKPLWYNLESPQPLMDTIFFEKSIKLFTLDFGLSDGGRDIGQDLRERFLPSLAIAVPSLLLGLLLDISLALLLTFFKGTRLDAIAVFVCVVLMSISGLFYIIGAQYLISKLMKWLPISGFATGLSMWVFLILPVLTALISGVGSGTRWYRTLFLEEVNKDYVRTARAKGLNEHTIMWRHVCRNAMIPIVTGVVVLIPLLFLGSLLTESFFGIPGLGSYTIDAINQQDFAIVRSIVFLGSVLYIIGLILTDIAYTLVDPRVGLH